MYRFETAYTKENIKTLTRAQVHAYYWKPMMAALLLGIFLVAVSVASINSSQLAVILTAVGCWLSISSTYPAQYLAKMIHKKMGDGSRNFVYVFSQDGIRIESGSGRNQISYHQIQKMIETKDGFCVFLTRNSGFLLLKAELGNQQAKEDFKEYIKERTGLTAEQEQSLFLRFMKLRLIKKRV